MGLHIIYIFIYLKVSQLVHSNEMLQNVYQISLNVIYAWYKYENEHENS
jgi:hypothetical protein